MTAALDEAKELAARVLGHEGRNMSMSKSGYSRALPTNVAVFNSRVVVALSDGYCENVWWGDLDLTLWEQRLAVLARLLDRRVYLLYEGDDRSAYPREPREFAVACFSPGTETTIPERHSSHIVRAEDGTLRRFIPPEARKRWQWRVLLHVPRLWRLWAIERKRNDRQRDRPRRSSLIYLGSRESGASPLLVVGRFRERDSMSTNRWLEWTWYPARGEGRAAAKPLLDRRLEPRFGRTIVWVHLVVWPGQSYQLYAGAKRWVAE